MAEFIEGKEYKTLGGWDALVIWKDKNTSHVQKTMVVVHKKCTDDETISFHFQDSGKSVTNFSVNERPCFGSHPADLLFE